MTGSWLAVLCVQVGEKHSMALCSWSVPPLPDAHGFLAAQQQHQQAGGVPVGLHSPASSGSATEGDLEHLPGSSSSSGGSSPDKQQQHRGGLHHHQGEQQGYGAGASGSGPSTPQPQTSGCIARAANGGRDQHTTVESLQVCGIHPCSMELGTGRAQSWLPEFRQWLSDVNVWPGVASDLSGTGNKHAAPG